MDQIKQKNLLFTKIKEQMKHKETVSIKDKNKLRIYYYSLKQTNKSIIYGHIDIQFLRNRAVHIFEGPGSTKKKI